MPPAAVHPITMATPQPPASTWQSQHSDATRWPAPPALRLPKAQRREQSRGKPLRVTGVRGPCSTWESAGCGCTPSCAPGPWPGQAQVLFPREALQAEHPRSPQLGAGPSALSCPLAPRPTLGPSPSPPRPASRALRSSLMSPCWGHRPVVPSEARVCPPLAGVPTPVLSDSG